MMDEKRLEQEYRKLKHQAAPDLWARIEGSLKDHPERAGEAREAEGIQELRQEKRRKTPVYGMAAAAAAILVLVTAAPQLNRTGSSKNAAPAVDLADEAATEACVAEDMAVDTAASAVAAAETQAAVTAGGGRPGAGASAQPPAVSGEAGATEDSSEERASAEGAVRMEADSGGGRMQDGVNVLADGVLDYHQLQLAAWQPLQVPGQAVTVPEDSQYFSEGILEDTGLLCGATVISAELETDGSGKAVKVVYELALDQVYYAEDYTTGMDQVTVKSPIITTDGDEAYVLYQLQPGGTYLLPLRKLDGDWELLYPFAPQIQVTGNGAYLFHSGYASLVTEETFVVIGSQEGENDYYYDRMLLREDGNFLSDFVSLVEYQVQGRKKER